MTISVIVPNYNGIGMLRNCLVSLFEHDRKPDQIVVVDNGSSDNSPDIIRKEFPQVTLVSLNRNTGFTGANNAGLQASTGNLLVLLNNDCIVEPNWLNSLLGRMEDKSVAAVSSSMRNINDLSIMDSAGGQFDWLGFSKDICEGEPASRFVKPIELPFPCAGAAMIRRSSLPSQSRLFWDKLFAYQEDLDLGFELIRTGWKIVYEPTAVVRHIHSATAVKGSFFKEYHCVRNRLLVMRKHFDRKTFIQLLPVIRTWQNLWITASIVRGQFKLAKAIFKGTKEGLTMPVEPFIASIPLGKVFSQFAVRNSSTGLIKNGLYNRAENIINSRD